jgi:hypothetical protein
MLPVAGRLRLPSNGHPGASSARSSMLRSNDAVYIECGPLALDDARRSYDEIRSLLFGALAKLPGFWVGRFESLSESRHLAVDQSLHDDLVRSEESAIRNNDLDRLRELTFRLSENQVNVAGPGGSDILSGLTRD